MKELTIRYKELSVSIDEISDFEKKYDITFPDYFKEFLLLYNGAGLVENWLIQDETIYIVNNILPLHSNINASIELILPAVKDPVDGIGRNDLIPFGIDPGGRPFYVSTGESDYGYVYYDLLGIVEEHEDPLLKIADSFEEFINRLQNRDLNT
jgi:hypothetical protein